MIPHQSGKRLPGEVASSDRERHIRAVSYVLVALVLALIGYYFIGFDRVATVWYGVAIYLFLNALNYRSMFGRSGQNPEQPGGAAGGRGQRPR